MALTPHIIESFGHGITGAALTAGGGIASAITGVPSVGSAGAFTGSYGLTVAQPSSGASVELRFPAFPAGQAFGLAQFKFRWRQAPGTSTVIAQLYTAAGRNVFLNMQTNGDIAVIYFDGTSNHISSVFGTTINTWYVLTFSIDTSTTTTLAKLWGWTPGGTPPAALTASGSAAAASTLTTFGVSGLSNTTQVLDFDDVAVLYGSAAADVASVYPEHLVKTYAVNASGTHSLEAGRFFKNVSAVETAIVAGETTSYQAVDEQPIGSDSDRVLVKGTSVSASRYIEYAFADEAAAIPEAVRAVCALRQDAADASGVVSAYLVRGDTQASAAVFTDLAVNSATQIYKSKLFAAAPGGGAWTRALLNGLLLDYGFTTSAAGVMRLEGAVLEALIPAAATTTYTDVVAGSANVGGSTAENAGSSLPPPPPVALPTDWTYDGASTITATFTPPLDPSQYSMLVDHDPKTYLVDVAPPPPPPPPSTGAFPIGVWLQNSANAAAYKAIGINTYIGLNDADTNGFNTLKANGIGCHLISASQSAGIAYNDATTIRGWLQQDEPDNSQQTSTCSGDCPCTDPSVVQAAYSALKNADPLGRPVYLNLGRTLGYPAAPDRGSFCSGPTRGALDFPKYYLGCDIASNDCYPVNDSGGILTVIGDAVDRMIQYAPGKPVSQILECTQIQSTWGSPTPAQTRCETWLAVIHGANEIVYFCHIFTPSFVEAGLLTASTAMKNQVAVTNAQIQALAPVLATGSIGGGSVSASSRVDFCVKQLAGVTYLLATAPLAATSATFTLPSTLGISAATATVIDENRSLSVSGGRFTDSFAQYGVHLYRIG